MSTTLGLKLTHDATVALIDGDRLAFSVELEKVNNGARYTTCRSVAEIESVLAARGVAFKDIDTIAIDGWKGGSIKPWLLGVAPYHEYDGSKEPMDLLAPTPVSGGLSAVSYKHVAGHVIGSYIVSDFAARGEPAYCISWDGGLQPRVHHVDPVSGKVKFVGTLFELYGVLYGIMGYYFGPYKKEAVYSSKTIDAATIINGGLYGGYDTPGKLMSYIALGAPSERIIEALEAHYGGIERALRGGAEPLAYNRDGLPEHELCRFAHRIKGTATDADALASIHTFLERTLVRRAVAALPRGSNLIFTGGCALNIKWNTALRESGHFSSVFVPPFPNDCGSAIGAAAVQAWHEGVRRLHWDVYSGPALLRDVAPGWMSAVCSPQLLGAMLADNKDEAIVVLHGNAELGPRALGHRSLFMSPELKGNQALLNKLKRREDFRPVAPICLEEFAQEIFDPGTPDPWMLFDHAVRAAWLARIPAVVHVDGTARLQTINKSQCKTTTEIIQGYYAATGVPLLCNTSANALGCGFFPDVASAQRWAAEAGVKHVWAEGTLWSRA